ncbi:MAG: hypothetical protein IPK66_08700 [Rhodospirillales bacterium]|nr:hypothetical protein [Rhodospirillales bacterium]
MPVDSIVLDHEGVIIAIIPRAVVFDVADRALGFTNDVDVADGIDGEVAGLVVPRRARLALPQDISIGIELDHEGIVITFELAAQIAAGCADDINVAARIDGNAVRTIVARPLAAELPARNRILGPRRRRGEREARRDDQRARGGARSFAPVHGLLPW